MVRVGDHSGTLSSVSNEVPQEDESMHARGFHRLGLLSLALGVALGLSGCRTFDVRTDWDATVSFDAFHAYFWLEPPELEGASPFADNSLIRKRIRTAVEAELAERGFHRVEGREEADFLVSYSVVLEERYKVSGISSVNGGFPDPYVGYGVAVSTGNVRPYQVSTLIIDLLDPRNDDLVWRGWASGVVRTRDRDPGHARMEKGIREILEAFPPKRGKPD
jgi:hypothetical protein